MWQYTLPRQFGIILEKNCDRHERSGIAVQWYGHLNEDGLVKLLWHFQPRAQKQMSSLRNQKRTYSDVILRWIPTVHGLISIIKQEVKVLYSTLARSSISIFSPRYKRCVALIHCICKSGDTVICYMTEQNPANLYIYFKSGIQCDTGWKPAEVDILTFLLYHPLESRLVSDR